MANSASDRFAVTGPGLPPPAAAYSAAIVAGDLVQVAGQGSLTADGEVTGLGDIGLQTERALSLVDRILAEAGSSFRDVVMVRVYLTSQDLYGAMNEAYSSYVATAIGNGPYPARTTLVTGLPLAGMLVEVDALAVRRRRVAVTGRVTRLRRPT